MRPKPLIPTRTVIGALPHLHVESVDYSRADRAPSPTVAGSWRERRRPRATSAPPRAPPRSAASRSSSTGEAVAGVVERTRRPARRGRATAAQVVGDVEPGGLRRPAGAGCRPAPPAPRSAATASREPGDAQHRQQARVERARREHHLVGGGDGVRPRRAWPARRRAPARRGGCPAAGLHRHLALDRPAASVDLGLEHDRLGGRRAAPGRPRARSRRPRRARRGSRRASR